MGSRGRTRGIIRAGPRPHQRRSRRLNPNFTPSTPSPRGNGPDENDRDDNNDNEDSNNTKDDINDVDLDSRDSNAAYTAGKQLGTEAEADPDPEHEAPYAIIHVPIRIRRRKKTTQISHLRLWARRQGQGMRRLPPPLVYGLSIAGSMALGWTAARIRGSTFFLSGLGVGLVVGSLVHGPRKIRSRRRGGEEDDDDTSEYQTQWQTIRVWGVE